MSEPHVLVVDDHSEIREPLAAYLHMHGMRVGQAADAAAARASLAKQAIFGLLWPLPRRFTAETLI
jgi:two-component system, OmpR family, response regulator